MAPRNEELVWYAAYGSNCSRERLLAYLVGGPVGGAGPEEIGARDPSPPRADAAFEFPHQICFSGTSSRWDGGVAYLEHRVTDPGALGRRYLLTWEQLDDLVSQENRRISAPLPIHETGRGVRRAVGRGPYDSLLGFEPLGGIPVVTFTSPEPREDAPTNAPSAAYLATIAQGLATQADLSPAAVVSRLLAAPGVADGWTAAAIERLIRRPSRSTEAI